MPLTVEAPDSAGRTTDPIVIGLVNNMPDAALEATETQFTSLLAAASGEREVVLRLTYLPEIARGGQACERIARAYWPLEAVLEQAPDALVVTGTEPHSAALEEEPYWDRMVQLLDWARSHAASSIWSCLAAHAAVQALDGIRRYRLPEKRFGVFAQRAQAEHPLLKDLQQPLVTPHSRWNDLPVEALRAAGYTIVSASAQSGADLIVRQDSRPLIAFQGHPEYEAHTLLLEYRRDVGRFLRGERAAWPSVPYGYFSCEALELLQQLRRRAERERAPALLSEFPTERLAAGLTAPWRPAAIHIYRNWLSYLAQTRTGACPRRRVSVSWPS